MRVLGIETTCDETAASVVERLPDGTGRILSNAVLSQARRHASYGGVVPEIASRAHVDAVDRIVAQALQGANVNFGQLDGVAAAAGPGLIGGVIVGLTTAKAIAFASGRPFLAINHLEGHALTARLTDNAQFPYLLLLVSGGHSQLVAVEGVGKYTRLGTTIDDAIGEAFDKVGKMLGLGYPGGPAVERMARQGDPQRFTFPRPMIGRPDPNFSLSGLKTAVRIEAEQIAPLKERDVADLCAGFQAAIIDTILDRVRVALGKFKTRFGQPTALVAAGGVAANMAIRDGLARLSEHFEVPLLVPPVELCGDNGAMIAWAGLERLSMGLRDPMSFAPRARWPLDEDAAAPGARA